MNAKPRTAFKFKVKSLLMFVNSFTNSSLTETRCIYENTHSKPSVALTMWLSYMNLVTTSQSINMNYTGYYEN